jgi:hypothetical protein
MTTLFSSSDDRTVWFLTLTKSVLLRVANAMEKSRLRQVQREIYILRRFHNISSKHDDDIAFLPAYPNETTKLDSLVD